MSYQQRCTCGLLQKYSRDPRVPIEYDPESDSYRLKLSEQRFVRVDYCPFCGGHEKQNDDSDERCVCKTIQGAASEPGTIIRFDPEMNEYGGPHLDFYYCPVCGGRMPESTRGDRFMEKSDDEVSDLFSITKGLNTLEEVIHVLGEPDDISEPEPLSKEDIEIYGGKIARRQLLYSKRWKTINAVVQLMEDGQVLVACSGKFKGKGNS